MSKIPTYPPLSPSELWVKVLAQLYDWGQGERTGHMILYLISQSLAFQGLRAGNPLALLNEGCQQWLWEGEASLC